MSITTVIGVDEKAGLTILGFLDPEDFYSYPIDFTELVNDFYWRNKKEIKDPQRLFRKAIVFAKKTGKIEYMKYLVSRRAIVNNSHFELLEVEAEKKRITPQKIALAFLVDNATADLLSELLFGADEELTLFILQRVSRTAFTTSPDRTFDGIKKAILENASDYSEVAIKYDDIMIFRFTFSGVFARQKDKFPELLNLAIEVGARACFIHILTYYKDAVAIVITPEEKWDMGNLKYRKMFTAKMEKAYDLVKGTKFEERIKAVRDRTDKWVDFNLRAKGFGPRAVLMISLHIDIVCLKESQCAKELNEAFERILNGNYYEETLARERKALDKYKEIDPEVNTEDPTSQDDLAEFPPLTVLVYTQAAPKKVFIFGPASVYYISVEKKNPFSPDTPLSTAFLAEVASKAEYLKGLGYDLSNPLSLKTVVARLRGEEIAEEVHEEKGSFKVKSNADLLAESLEAPYLPKKYFSEFADPNTTDPEFAASLVQELKKKLSKFINEYNAAQRQLQEGKENKRAAARDELQRLRQRIAFGTADEKKSAGEIKRLQTIVDTPIVPYPPFPPLKLPAKNDRDLVYLAVYDYVTANPLSKAGIINVFDEMFDFLKPATGEAKGEKEVEEVPEEGWGEEEEQEASSDGEEDQEDQEEEQEEQEEQENED